MVKKKKIIFILVCFGLAILLLLFCGIVVAHNIVFSRADYSEYASNKYLVYDDVSEKYPREKFNIYSGNNRLSAYIYGKSNDKGIVVIAPGHRDANDIKIYEARYFVDAGYAVVVFDYTGCYTSEGKNMVGYNQAVHDLDAVLSHIENDDRFVDKPLILFGHSMGGYAVAAELQFGHNIRAAVVASALNTPEEQWQYSTKRFTGFLYPILRPLNSLYINLKYGEEKNLSAINGINSVDIPVLVLCPEDDIYYGGESPIYKRRDEITNTNCTTVLMDKERHNGHYDYFLTDNALDYQASKSVENIDKELYMEHDDSIMKKICNFYDLSLEK